MAINKTYKDTLIVFIICGLILGLLYLSLGRSQTISLKSPLINQPLPQLQAEILAKLPNQSTELFEQTTLNGAPWVLNIWASWCLTCINEHPHIQALSQLGVPVIGINYKDQAKHAWLWLEQHGNPFTAILYDPRGRTGIDLGVYGVPETFIIDKEGIIRDKFTGPIDAQILTEQIIPLLTALGHPFATQLDE